MGSLELRGFLYDRLNLGDRKAVLAKIEQCASCRNEIEGFESVDRLVKAYFQHELRQIHSPRRVGWPVHRVAAAGLAILAIIAVVVIVPKNRRPALDEPLANAPASDATQIGPPKDTGSAAAAREKLAPPPPDSFSVARSPDP